MRAFSLRLPSHFGALPRRAWMVTMALAGVGCGFCLWHAASSHPGASAAISLWIAGSALLASLVVAALASWGQGCARAADDGAIAEGPNDAAGLVAQQRLRAILDFSPALIDVKDSEGRYLLTNRQFNEKFAPGKEEVTGQAPEDLLPAEVAAEHRARHRAVLAQGLPVVQELTCQEHDGVHAYVAAQFPLRDLAGRIDSVCCIATDITDQKQIETRLREQANLLDQAGDAIVASDLDGHVTFWNSTAARMLGWSAEEALGRSVDELFVNAPSGHFIRMRQVLLAHGEWRGELAHSDDQGTPHHLELRASLLRDRRGGPRGCIVTCTDVTEKRLLNEQFLRAQRLESIGMLATGIAHDLNNVLAPIGMASALLRGHVGESEVRLLDTLDRCAERGADLIRQVLGFTHGISGGTRLVQVKHLMRDVVLIMKETFPKSIELRDDIPRDLLPVECNPTQVHQVLMNLCVNARDAMSMGGVLTLRGRNCHLDADAAAKIEGARAGTWVVLEVGDTGAGIPAKVLTRIWEPFFTTKDLNQGTGLGLPTVRGIVATHQGFIELETEEGKGTVFRIYLPAAEERTTEGADPRPATAASGHGQRVLVVDDEPFVRDTISRILCRAGYRVKTACNGHEATAVFDAESAPFDAVIVDSRMPIIDGDQLAGIIRQRFPATRILRISGAATPGDPVSAKSGDDELAKPFTAGTLLSTIDRLLRVSSPTP